MKGTIGDRRLRAACHTPEAMLELTTEPGAPNFLWSLLHSNAWGGMRPSGAR